MYPQTQVHIIYIHILTGVHMYIGAYKHMHTNRCAHIHTQRTAHKVKVVQTAWPKFKHKTV